MGCLFRLGCLCVLLVAGVVGWFTRDRWMPARIRDRVDGPARRVAEAPTWRPLSDAAADSTRAALAKLNTKTGQVYQTLSGTALTSYVFRQIAPSLPPSTDSLRAMVVDDQVRLRAIVPLKELGGAGALGSIGGMFGNEEPVEMSGTLRVIHPGLAEYRVRDVKVHDLSLPRSLIPGLIKRFDRADRPAGLDADALPLPIPAYVGDIRVANGKVTLYKNVD
jgi:hypothetical protein